jgi:hypothetical protein
MEQAKFTNAPSAFEREQLAFEKEKLQFKKRKLEIAAAPRPEKEQDIYPIYMSDIASDGPESNDYLIFYNVNRAVAIIVKKSEILLIHERRHEGPGEWNCPIQITLKGDKIFYVGSMTNEKPRELMMKIFTEFAKK